MIDLDKSRINAAAAAQQQAQVQALVLQADCPITAVDAVVWSDNRTALAQTDADGIFACRTDGTKLAGARCRPTSSPAGP